MPKKMPDIRVEKRLRREIEGLYGNEALTTSLDDSSAKILLQWAEDQVRKIVGTTEGLDDETADEKMYPQMKAIRRIGRYINMAVSTPEANPKLVEKIFQQAKVLYGESFSEPDREKLQALLVSRSDPANFIQTLKQSFEGEVDGPEKNTPQFF